MSGPRFYLVTNDAPRAALELWCHMGNLPASVVVTDNPDVWLRIPDGAQVRCFWYGPREELQCWENFWTIRRAKGGFQWISEEDWSRLMDWAEVNRKAPTLLLLHGVGLDDAAPEEAPVLPALPAIEQTTSNKRGQKWT